MAKRRSPSFLARKTLLSKDEFEEYQELKKRLQIPRYKKELEELKRKEKEQRFSKTRTGRIGSAISSGLKLAKPGGVTRKLYRTKTYTRGRVGRPRGSVKYTDPKTGQPIGVYEYRKILASRLRRERGESLRRSAITPQQQVALERIERRRKMQSLNPEGRTIPTTHGTVFLNDIMGEIDEASNIVS